MITTPNSRTNRSIPSSSNSSTNSSNGRTIGLNLSTKQNANSDNMASLPSASSNSDRYNQQNQIVEDRRSRIESSHSSTNRLDHAIYHRHRGGEQLSMDQQQQRQYDYSIDDQNVANYEQQEGVYDRRNIDDDSQRSGEEEEDDENDDDENEDEEEIDEGEVVYIQRGQVEHHDDQGDERRRRQKQQRRGGSSKKSNQDVAEPVYLEELEAFSSFFKQKRIQLGFTQGDVGLAMGRLYGNDFSQTTVSRFEALNLSFKNMCKLKPLLEKWLLDAEKAVEAGVFTREMLRAQLQQEQRDSESQHHQQSEEREGASRRRKKRTSIEGNLRQLLEDVFESNPRPSMETVSGLAATLDMEQEVIRVWFCNRRQRARRTNPNINFPQESPHAIERFKHAAKASGLALLPSTVEPGGIQMLPGRQYTLTTHSTTIGGGQQSTIQISPTTSRDRGQSSSMIISISGGGLGTKLPTNRTSRLLMPRGIFDGTSSNKVRIRSSTNGGGSNTVLLNLVHGKSEEGFVEEPPSPCSSTSSHQHLGEGDILDDGHIDEEQQNVIVERIDEMSSDDIPYLDEMPRQMEVKDERGIEPTASDRETDHVHEDGLDED